LLILVSGTIAVVYSKDKTFLQLFSSNMW